MADSVPGSVGDYAAAIGTTGFDYTVTVTVGTVPVAVPPTGPFVQSVGLRTADITDGLTHTIFIGEKHVPTGAAVTYPYDCSLYDGHNYVCSTRSAGPGFPLAQGPPDPRLAFGGPHIGVCMFVFADGGVRPVRTSVDEIVLGQLSHRADGLPAPTDY